MTVTETIKDAGKTVAAAVTMDADELRRLEKRREIRKGLAQKRLLLDKAAIVKREIDRLSAETDAAVSEHASATEPIQAKLRKIESGITSALSEQKAVPDGLERQRTELLGELLAANETLEESTGKVRRLMDPLLREHSALLVESAEFGTDGRLAQPGVGHPALLAELFSNKIRIAHASSRVDEARRQIAMLEPALDTAKRQRYADHIGSYSRRLFEWRTELTFASQEFEAAQAENNEIVSRLIAE